MAVVGTAYVRLRVIGDKLKQDLAKSVHDAVNTNPEIEKAGETVGEKITEGVTKHMSGGTNGFDKVADDIGNALGKAMGDSMGRSLRNRMSTSLKDTFIRMRPIVSKAGTDLSNNFSTFKDGIEKRLKKINISDFLIPGIAALVVALPSLLAGAGAVIGAYAATAITALSTIGPAVVGGALAGVAALSALKITTGLVGLAMKTVTPSLTDFQSRAEKFKVLIATPIQAGLLSGLNGSMRLLTPMITSMGPALTRLGIAVGDIALDFADAVNHGLMLERLNTILANNTAFVTTAGAGVSAFAQAFIVLLAHLGPVLDFLGTGIQDLGQWALAAIQGAEATGTLDSFITRMFDSLRYFVGILVDFGAGIYNVFKAAYGASGGMLTNLHDIAESFRKWTGDPANQDRMTAFFDKMRVIVAQVDGILSKLVGGALKALEGTNLDSLTSGLQTLSAMGAPLAALFKTIQDNAGPQLQQMFQNLVDVLTQLSTSGVLGTTVNAFSTFLVILTNLLAVPGFPQLLTALISLSVILKTVSAVMAFLGPIFEAFAFVGGILGTVLEFLIATFGVFAVGIGAIVAAVAVVVAALVYFFGFTETGRAIVKAAFDGIMAAVKATWDFLVMAFNAIVAAFQVAIGWIVSTAQTVGGALAGAWNAVVSGVTTAWNAVVGAIQTALTTVWSIITSVWSAVVGFIAPILATIFSIISGVFNAIWTVVSTILNALLAFWTAIFIILLIPIRVFEGVVILIWQGIVALITWAVNLILAVATTVWNAIYGAISSYLLLISTEIGVVWNAISTAISTVLNFIWGIITAVWGAISGAISSYLTVISGQVSAVWGVISGAISAAMNFIWGIISSVWGAISGAISSFLAVIRGQVSSVWSGISLVVSTAMSAVQNTITSVWNSVIGFLRGAMNTISGIVSGVWGALENAGSGIVSGLKNAVNGVVGLVNGAIGGINSVINTANKLPGVDIPTISTIPRLAKGGVVSPTGGGTLAMIAEAGHKERVEPLDADGLSKRDRAILNQFSMSAGNGKSTVNVYLGTGQLMELIDVVVEEREDALAGAVSTGRKG